MLKKYWLILLTIAAVLLLGTATMAWLLFSPNTRNTESEYFLFVSKTTRIDDVIARLQTDKMLNSVSSFRMIAEFSNSGEKLKPGRYSIEPHMSNYTLLQRLRNGLQTPLKFTFNNINYPEDFCGVAGSVFHFDSLAMTETVRDRQLLDSLGVRPEMLLGYLLPNTYEVYWTTTPEGLIKRMLRESEQFWAGARTEILKQRGLTKEEVLILASITQKETNHQDEMSRIAGVYINRLRIGMKLQADPTVKYANGDLTLRRVLNEHLEHTSPYNTYQVTGLPPGVICAPNPSTIDKVLQYEEHNYLYFAAKPGYQSKHTFAVTYSQHLQNARNYHRWLRSEGIR
jgi:UPF0755 protein